METAFEKPIIATRSVKQRGDMLRLWLGILFSAGFTFLFGFAGIFVITQMYSLGLSLWARWAFLALYIAGVILIYSSRGVSYLRELTAISLIDYLGVIVLALLLGLCVRLFALFSPPKNTTMQR